jgi:hypothetical protein
LTLKLRPTGFGSGAYKDNVDSNVFSGESLIGRFRAGRGRMTRLEQRGGVAIAFMAAAPWIMLLIAAAILAETDRCLITSRTLPQSRI